MVASAAVLVLTEAPRNRLLQTQVLVVVVLGVMLHEDPKLEAMVRAAAAVVRVRRVPSRRIRPLDHPSRPELPAVVAEKRKETATAAAAAVMVGGEGRWDRLASISRTCGRCCYNDGKQ